MKRLSQTLHLCFFCVLDESFELNWPIMDCGAGGRLALTKPDGRGKVLELTDSMSDDCELYSETDESIDP